MLKKLLITIICLSPLTSYAENSITIKKATESIKFKMKDPESTQFRNLKTVSNTLGETSVCGEVNSKNSYGAYNGFKPFAYTDEGFSLVDDSRYATLLYEPRLNLAGCNGKEKEIAERNSIAHRDEIAKNPQVFQDFCSSIYGTYVDVIAKNTPREVAIEKLQTTYKEKKLYLLNPSWDDLKIKFQTGLSNIEQLPVAVKAIKKNDKKFEMQHLNQCVQQFRNKGLI